MNSAMFATGCKIDFSFSEVMFALMNKHEAFVQHVGAVVDGFPHPLLNRGGETFLCCSAGERNSLHAL